MLMKFILYFQPTLKYGKTVFTKLHLNILLQKTLMCLIHNDKIVKLVDQAK